MLRLALGVAQNLGLEKVLITCNKKNIGSARTITKNGGILESEGVDEGTEFQRYWIKL
jgi:predicted acetyltransferase